MSGTRTFLRHTPPTYVIVRPNSWRDSAACNGHPDLPAQTWDDTTESDGWGRGLIRTTRPERVADAIAVCEQCPVRLQCLADVDLSHDEGIRGGVDLRVMVREARQAAADRRAAG